MNSSKRKCAILYQVIDKSYPEYHLLISDLIYNSKYTIPMEELVEKLLSITPDFRILQYLYGLFVTSDDADRLGDFLDFFMQSAKQDQLYLTSELQNLYEKLENKSASVENQTEEYPFSRRKKLEKLKEIIEKCNESNLYDSRQRFLRTWTREKDEHDKKVNKKKR